MMCDSARARVTGEGHLHAASEIPCFPICGETEGRGGKHDFQTWRTPDLIMEPCPSPHGLTNSTLQSNSDPEIPQILIVAHPKKEVTAQTRSYCLAVPRLF